MIFKSCPACGKNEFRISLCQGFTVNTFDYIAKRNNLKEYIDFCICISCNYSLGVKERESLENLIKWEEQE